MTLALENADHFHASPSLDFDTLYREGDALSREFAWEISFSKPEQLLNLYRELVIRYQTAFTHVQTAAAAVRAHALHTLGSPLTDVRAVESPADPEFATLASDILTRDIFPSQKTSEEWRARNKTALIIGHPDTVMNGTESWPRILNPEKIWANAFADQDYLNWEAWGLGSLQMTYVPFWSEPYWGGGDIFESILYAKPNFEYVVNVKDSVGKITRIGTGMAKFDSKVTVVGSGGQYQIGTASINFPSYLKNNSPPLGIPVFSTDLKAEDVSSRLEIARRKVQNGVRDELVTQLKSPTGDLSQALLELDGAVNALRGLTMFAFPETLERNDTLRGILFGRNSPSGGKWSVAPLLTSQNALDLVLWPEQSKASDGPDAATLHEDDPSNWPNSTFLRDLGSQTEASLHMLLMEIQAIVRDPANGPQAQPAVSEQLGRLATLKHIKDDDGH